MFKLNDKVKLNIDLNGLFYGVKRNLIYDGNIIKINKSKQCEYSYLVRINSIKMNIWFKEIELEKVNNYSIKSIQNELNRVERILNEK